MPSEPRAPTTTTQLGAIFGRGADFFDRALGAAPFDILRTANPAGGAIMALVQCTRHINYNDQQVIITKMLEPSRRRDHGTRTMYGDV